MKKKNNVLVVLLFLFMLNPIFFYSQSTYDIPAYYNWFDTVVGSNTSGLYNGVLYEEEYIVKNDRYRFFISNDFMKGTIKYDEQSYFDLSLKYDVYGDEVLVKLQDGFGEVVLQLIKNKIDNFTINNHQFYRIHTKKIEEVADIGFYEVLVKNTSFILYKKHKKNKKQRLENKKMSYEFFDKHIYILFYNDLYYRIKSQKDITNIFPDYKETINLYYKKDSRSIQKSDLDTFLTTLLKRIDTLIMEKK
ncbi:hypothetical protein [Aquimarina longa]|uniref:hypothetical protein n=1 Tax=Aquimarina longa TaxID=1080221 RepID=UPI00078564FD|nr:hypothetical protein [Aquimarina longa]